MHIPVVFVECKFFGGKDYESFEFFDGAMKAICREAMGIEPFNLYIKYEVLDGRDESARIFKI